MDHFERARSNDFFRYTHSLVVTSQLRSVFFLWKFLFKLTTITNMITTECVCVKHGSYKREHGCLFVDKFWHNYWKWFPVWLWAQLQFAHPYAWSLIGFFDTQCRLPPQLCSQSWATMSCATSTPPGSCMDTAPPGPSTGSTGRKASWRTSPTVMLTSSVCR